VKAKNSKSLNLLKVVSRFDWGQIEQHSSAVWSSDYISVESLYVESNEESFYRRRERLSLQYALQLSSTPANPTFDMAFNPLSNVDTYIYYDVLKM